VTVVNQFDEGHYASLVFDRLNRPMIAHHDVTNGDLRFSVQEPGIGWVTTTVNATGSYPSIAIDPDSGFPAIAFYNGDLNYGSWDGDSWNLTIVDAPGLVGVPSLAFDPADGNPAIAYTDSTNGDLKLAWHDGSTWRVQIVDAVGDVGDNPSLAFNDYGNGFPAIAYVDGTFGNAVPLYFIEDPPAPAVPEPASLLLLAWATLITCFRSGRRRRNSVTRRPTAKLRA
jgi:hypothetical protein